MIPPPEEVGEDGLSDHSSIHEDEPERPNFVPKPVAQGQGLGAKQAAGPLILRRKTTLSAKQIQSAMPTPNGESAPT